MRRSIALTERSDLVKKWLSCLGCGRQMWTDRCHRFCRKCGRRNNACPPKRTYHTALPSGVYLEESAATSRPFDY